MLFGLGLPPGSYANPREQQQPATPFVWGQGGVRVTPDQVARQRELAQAMMAQGMDFSPVGHWAQGAARASQAILGALQMKKADKAADGINARSASVAEALMNNPDRRTVLAAMADPGLGENARSVAELLAEQMFAKPASPHYWETNDGSLGMVGPDGKPVVLYKDPTPKVQYIRTENGDGTYTITPMINGQPAGGGGQASGASAGPPATLPPDFFDEEGGADASRVGADFLDGF